MKEKGDSTHYTNTVERRIGTDQERDSWCEKQKDPPNAYFWPCRVGGGAMMRQPISREIRTPSLLNNTQGRKSKLSTTNGVTDACTQFQINSSTAAQRNRRLKQGLHGPYTTIATRVSHDGHRVVFSTKISRILGDCLSRCIVEIAHCTAEFASSTRRKQH